MADHDWYRHETWNDAIEIAFFHKLARCRSQRDQHLVIQAVILANKCPQVTLRLTDLYFETRKSSFDDLRAYSARADAYTQLGDMPAAVMAHKAALNCQKEFPNVQGNSGIDLPYLIAREGIEREYDFALGLLEETSNQLEWPVQHYRWHAARALILMSQGQESEAVLHAREAVRYANIRRSGFRYHQSLGLVGREDKNVVKLMYKLAASL